MIQVWPRLGQQEGWGLVKAPLVIKNTGREEEEKKVVKKEPNLLRAGA